MSALCRAVDRLLVRGRRPEAELADHVATCGRCRTRLQAFERVRGAIAEARADVVPDAGFSARVLERIAEPPNGLVALGAAARQLLPLAAALLLVLALRAATLDRPPSLETLVLGGAGDDELVALLVSSPTETRR